MKRVIRITIEADSGPVSPDYQWHEVLILTPKKAELTRNNRSDRSLIQSGNWSITPESEMSAPFFTAVSAIEYEGFRRRQPPIPPDGGSPISYTLVREGGETICLSFDPGVDYPGSENLIRLIKTYIQNLHFPSESDRNTKH